MNMKYIIESLLISLELVESCAKCIDETNRERMPTTEDEYIDRVEEIDNHVKRLLGDIEDMRNLIKL